jgi:hypothetical protein
VADGRQTGAQMQSMMLGLSPLPDHFNNLAEAASQPLDILIKKRRQRRIKNNFVPRRYSILLLLLVTSWYAVTR